MNHEFYYSIVIKQKEYDFLKEIHGINFTHSNNLYNEKYNLPAVGRNQTGWVFQILDEIQTMAGEWIRFGCYWFLKGIRNATIKPHF